MPDQDPDRQPLDEADVRTIVRLVASASAGDRPAPERKRRLMSGLAEIVGADAWIWVVSRLDADNKPTALNLMHDGLDESQLALVFEASYSPDAPPPENEPFIREMSRGLPVTRRREDLVPDPDWRDDPHYERFRAPIGLDEFIFAGFPFGDGLFSAVGLHRKTGKPAFGVRDRRLAHIVVAEVEWLHRAGLPGDDGARSEGLSPRHRTVFGLLMQGWRRNQIAEHLGISEHTARDHMRAVYRHFGAADHLELISRFMHGDGGDVPGSRPAR